MILIKNIKEMKWLTLFLLMGIVFSFSACEEEDNKIPEYKWTLVWEDNFDGEQGASVDATKWKFDLGNGENGWGNQELQNYTDKPENVSLDGEGNLAITARKGFTSGRIKTKGLFEQAYGRFEARIKLPYGPGIWPAFWLLGADIDENAWPQCGEIDIMEERGQQPQLIHGTVHGPGYSGGNAITKSYGLENARFDTDFHIFAIEWTEEAIYYYVDDDVYQKITPDDVSGEWVYDHPFFIILNVAVGGNYVGFPTSQTPFPQSMLVDYVRVYKEAK